ncbi:hypothetical protein [Liquorilactobacillus mali]|uniref:Uncharacterized protein n=1 Tax=Liquorilactobacillus mali KCTC 3596 = DSM 20444 TaxID=1046596 RepID=A0A0R2E9G4_9LACO|nr:hypothetical protein [Liquorilactobacillus mali]KRN09383.1 hypothetical protein FD00_GL001106 [Liquorilactobacillus mali KCTC 3596 = DSM 20444]
MKIFQNKSKQVTHIVSSLPLSKFGIKSCCRNATADAGRIKEYNIDYDEDNLCSACVGQAYKEGLIKVETK